jgi:hypothetical protein
VPIIRNVVVHINNEQPVMVDLLAPPTPSDVSLICRNVRTMSGKKPVFVNATDSTYVIPIAHTNIVEVPKSSLDEFEAETAALAAEAAETAQTVTATARSDADYAMVPLSRLAWIAGVSDEPGGVDDFEGAPAPVSAGGPLGRPAAGAPPPAPPNPDELDDDLLRRIREA